MPYVLKHRATGEISASELRNVYDLVYYGAEWWDTEEEAAEAASARPDWEPFSVTEQRLKVLNVKLNNDASRKLFIDDDGTLRVETGSAR
ncbi:hypothetical protein [Paenibacillus sp.]|uniref:hypothetical protein n=1 Tax=Paenibacillus sp. TaxID=58172 RepID=UPI002D5491FD|nr:hypothetical protein [Paenibacillus sp.]HZG87654.1 hypothetical protein [Paenibacillus sp.]